MKIHNQNWVNKQNPIQPDKNRKGMLKFLKRKKLLNWWLIINKMKPNYPRTKKEKPDNMEFANPKTIALKENLIKGKKS